MTVVHEEVTVVSDSHEVLAELLVRESYCESLLTSRASYFRKIFLMMMMQSTKRLFAHLHDTL
jgi:hypothetical protein